MATATVTITLAGVARTVPLETYGEQPSSASVRGVVATIGAGTARYPSTLTLWAILDGARPGSYPHRATAARSGFGIVTDSEGRDWAVSSETHVRNRHARVIGWAEDKGVTNYSDQTRATA